MDKNEQVITAVNTSVYCPKKTECFLCSKPSQDECKYCNLVGFCSENHGILHRPESMCFPFVVETREGVGRVMVAARDVEPLELILWDEAAAMGPRMGGTPVCLQCLKPAKPGALCTVCGWPVCDEVCQNGAAHQMECNILSKSTEKIDFSNVRDVLETFRCIAPLRLLIVKNKCPEVWERLSYLMDHNEERKRDDVLWTLYQNSVNKYLKSCDVEFSDIDIDRAAGLLWTNSFACAKGGGQAIFPTFSFASHSCRPNCAHSVFPNKTLALQAKVKIEAGDEFTISYISTLQGNIKRKRKLKEKWFFDCACDRCSDPSEMGSNVSTLLCKICCSPDAFVVSLGARDPVSPWGCVKCRKETSAEQIEDVENKVASEMQKIENTSLPDFEKMIETAGTELHPHHYLMILLKRHLLGLYSAQLQSLGMEELQKVKQYGESVNEAYEIIDPGYHKDRGTVLRAHCEVSKLLAKKLLSAGEENEDQFKARVQTCVKLFQESQKCSIIRLKKDPFAASDEE